MEKLVFGVTGGVGAGKSTVLKILEEEYQAYVIEADAVGRRLEERGRPGFDAVVREFGEGILGEDGEIDRAKLAKLVFSDVDALQRLNGLLHPMIYEEIQMEIRREYDKIIRPEVLSGVIAPETPKKSFESDIVKQKSARPEDIEKESVKAKNARPDPKRKTGEPAKLFVLEAAILFETGFDRCCDRTLYVRADEKTRIARLQKSRGYSAEKAAGIIANQLKDEEFRSRADHVIENDGSLEETERQIKRIMENLLCECKC